MILNKCRAIIYLFVVSSLFVSCGVSRLASMPSISENSFYRQYPRLSQGDIDSLLLIYGSNKVFCDDFIEPTLIALSYYPELKETKISFEYSKEATTMAARPKTSSMFSRRRYLVLINDEEDFDGILLRNVPFNAQIGIIGHELAHIVDYQSMNFWGVLGILFRYSDSKRKPLFEKEIDYLTITRGLGWQLYDWALFSMYANTYATDDYKEFKRATYLTPDEIKAYIHFLARYGAVSDTLESNK